MRIVGLTTFMVMCVLLGGSGIAVSDQLRRKGKTFSNVLSTADAPVIEVSTQEVLDEVNTLYEGRFDECLTGKVAAIRGATGNVKNVRLMYDKHAFWEPDYILSLFEPGAVEMEEVDWYQIRELPADMAKQFVAVVSFGGWLTQSYHWLLELFAEVPPSVLFLMSDERITTAGKEPFGDQLKELQRRGVQIVRQYNDYKHSVAGVDAPGMRPVWVMPLGFMANIVQRNELPYYSGTFHAQNFLKASERAHSVAFIGNIKSDRARMIEAFETIENPGILGKAKPNNIVPE